MRNKNTKIDKTNFPDLLPKEYIDTFEKDYNDFVKEEREEKSRLEDKFRSRLFGLFNDDYKPKHIENIILSQLAQEVRIKPI